MGRPIDADALTMRFTLPEDQQQSLAGTIYGMVIKVISEAPTVAAYEEKERTIQKIAQLSAMLDDLFKDGKVEAKVYIQLSAAITSIACQP